MMQQSQLVCKKKIKILIYAFLLFSIVNYLLAVYFNYKIKHNEKFNMWNYFFRTLTEVILQFISIFGGLILMILFMTIFIVLICTSIIQRKYKENNVYNRNKKTESMFKSIFNIYRKILHPISIAFLIILCFAAALILPTDKMSKYVIDGNKIRPYKLLYYEIKDIYKNVEIIEIKDYEILTHVYNYKKITTGSEVHTQTYLKYSYKGKSYCIPDETGVNVYADNRFKIGKSNEICVGYYPNTGILVKIDKVYVSNDDSYSVKLKYATEKLGMPYKIVYNNVGGIKLQKNENYAESDYYNQDFNINYYQSVIKCDDIIIRNINISENDYTYIKFEKDGIYEICVHGLYKDIISNIVRYTVNNGMITDIKDCD